MPRVLHFSAVHFMGAYKHTDCSNQMVQLLDGLKVLWCHSYLLWFAFVTVLLFEEEVICYQLKLRNNLPTFRHNVPVVIRVKAKKVPTTVAIYSHALLRIHVIEGQRSVRIVPPPPPPLLPPHHYLIHWEETTMLDHGRGQELW